jgi:tetratricopeptide (TPR) repeat protein
MGFFARLFGAVPSSAREYYEKGLACEQGMDHVQAIANFTQAIQLDPRFADAHYARALTREITGDFEEAIADFERVIELNPTVGDELVVETDGDAGTARVIRLNSGVTWKEGLIEDGVGLDIARVCYQRGVQHVDAGDLEKAIVDFSATIERAPFPHDHLGPAYFERGRCYSRSGLFEDAVADLEQAAEFGPPDPQFRHVLHLLLGQCFLALEQFDAAIANLTTALEHDPESAEAYASRANAHYQQDHLDQAIADNSESIRLDPNVASTYLARSFVHADRGEFDKAIADATEAIRLAPDQATFYASRAAIHQAMGEHARAVADYDECIGLQPDRPERYQARASAHRALGNEESAARDEQTMQAVTHLHEAFARMQQEEWDQAISLLDRVIELAPGLHRGYLRRGLAHLARQEPDRAIADFNHIINQLPRPTHNWGPVFGAYVDAFMNRGNAAMCKGEFQKAIADYTEAIRLEPKLGPAYRDRARAYRAIGETTQALQDERQAQELNA